MSLRLLAILACLLGGAGSAAADDLGRLFTTPAERARIDAVRAGHAPDAAPETIVSSAADRLIVNGTLTGSDGRRAVWVNGTRVTPGGRDAALLGDGRVRLGWRDGTRALKPGQGLDLSSGEIFEGYARPADPAPVSTTAQAASPVAADAAPVASLDSAQDETKLP
jgi:hypothetical protein